MVYVLALGTFLMLTTEFVVAGILPEVATDLGISLGRAGLLITVFAAGMIVGAPLMAMATLRLAKRPTLILALVVFVVGHVVVALSDHFATLLAARFVTAMATGAFWAVAAVVASRGAGPGQGAKALGVVTAGGALATVLGVPAGALVAQLVGWRGTFWALALAAAIAVVCVAKLVPRDAVQEHAPSVRSELSALRSGRLWLALAACAATTGGVLAAYSYISPILTDRDGLSAGLVPLVLTVFGTGSFIGTLVAGRLGDAYPHRVTVVTPAVTIVLLAVLAAVQGSTWTTVALVALLGLFGLSANGVLIHLAVTHAGRSATLGSALSVSAFNAGTAVGTAAAGAALGTSLGLTGPPAVGVVIITLTLVPVVALAVFSTRRASGVSHTPAERSNSSLQDVGDASSAEQHARA